MGKSKNYDKDQLLQIAYYKLLQYSQDVVIVTESPYYDVIISSRLTSSKIAVKIYPTSYVGNSIVTQLYQQILQLNQSEKQLLLPIIILYVDANTGHATVQQLLNWHYGSATVYDPLTEKQVEWNENNANIIFAAMDKVICVLPQEMWSFKKIISLNSDDFLEAYIIYFRTFHDEYKMHPKPQLSEVEKFMRSVKGIPEDEYPKDELDEFILESVRKQYPDATINTSTLILNTELRDLQYYNRYKREKGKVIMLPDSNEIQMYFASHPDGSLTGLEVDMVYMPHLRNNPMGAICQLFSLEKTVSEMLVLEKLLDTCKPLSDYMDKGYKTYIRPIF